MIKKSIQLPIIYLIAATIWHLIASPNMSWLEHLMISFIIFLILVFYHWAKISHKT
ncbi:hypothetical protein [Aquisalibacillus elongatus]|uniref:hypothetical protein n=1 Tax=Aquisalibacillus elongatus TaxID=485577 RepID=UPI0014732D57|nr:hypothetical protein [Aquisalibacillus elongatus]